MTGDILGCHGWRGSTATGIYWVEAKDATKRSTAHGTVPATKNDPAQMPTVLR